MKITKQQEAKIESIIRSTIYIDDSKDYDVVGGVASSARKI